MCLAFWCTSEVALAISTHANDELEGKQASLLIHLLGGQNHLDITTKQ